MEQDSGKGRRRHANELKCQVLAECGLPGASVARESGARAEPRSEVFVPVAVAAAPPMAADIRIELRRGSVAINVTWPLGAAGQCAAWMREILR